MKLLLDEHQRTRLVPLLVSAYPGSTQVELLGRRGTNRYYCLGASCWVPEDLRARIAQADPATLGQWSRQLLTADSLEAVFD